MTETYETIVAIIMDEDKFLIVKKIGTWMGWQFVQGKMEGNESTKDTVLREIKEETGLKKIEIIKECKNVKGEYWFTWERTNIHKILKYFLVKADSTEEITLSREHSEAKWVNYEEALRLVTFNKKQFRDIYKELSQ